MDGKRILVTGPTGQVATPLVRSLAADNEVIGIARFRDPEARAELEAPGVTLHRGRTWPPASSTRCPTTSTTSSTSRW